MLALAVAACSGSVEPLQTAAPGVVVTFPANGQLDVPLGTRIAVTFTDPVVPGALGACAADGSGGLCLLGPAGPVDVAPLVVGDGLTVEIPSGALDPGTSYALHVGRALAPFAASLPATGPLVRFTTRSVRPRAAAPALVAIQGGSLATLAERPIYDTSTIRLVLSEPLEPRTVAAGPGSVELVAGGAAVPATVIAQGIHVAVDPVADLIPGTRYELRLGSQITDLGGRALAPIAIPFDVIDTRGAGGRIPQVLRTRQAGDPGPLAPRAGAKPNLIQIRKPIIGLEEVELTPAVLAAELSDPAALGGPLSFVIRRGQRIRTSGIDVKLGGEIPVGISTGEIQIELLTDAGGRIFRNPNQAASQRPENDRAPLHVELALDLAVYATDATGTAVLSQTVLGVQGTGVAIATEGVLAIEAMIAMDLGLLGITSAPANLVLELITSPGSPIPADTAPPALVASFPADGSRELLVDGGVELVFNEPIDLDAARAGAVRFEDALGAALPAAIESHGAGVVVRPLARLAYGTDYRVSLGAVRDVAGNRIAASRTLRLSTPRLAATNVPMGIAAIRPGAPCALTGATGASPGRCAGGAGADQGYRPFQLERDDSIEVELTRPVLRSSATLGTACGAGSVRVEELSAGGGCVAPVAGTLLVRDRGLAFVPDQPWTPGARYRLALATGGDSDCDAGELCGTNGRAGSFDPLSGIESGDGGGPALVVDFAGAAAGQTTPLFALVGPATDVNGSGFLDAGELLRDENRAALRITGTTGDISAARFTSDDCLPGTPGVEACMYLSGAMPVQIGELTTTCPLPGGATAAACLPVTLSPQAIYGTSVSINATLGLGINTDTGTTVLRIREPAMGPVTGYIVSGGAAPKLVVAVDLYMDAPDMSVPLSSHDLHSKPLSVTLEGPVRVLPDGRIAIAVANTADIPVTVNISAPLGLGGAVQMTVPRQEMKLQLVARPIRGSER